MGLKVKESKYGIQRIYLVQCVGRILKFMHNFLCHFSTVFDIMGYKHSIDIICE